MVPLKIIKYSNKIKIIECDLSDPNGAATIIKVLVLNKIYNILPCL